MRRSRSIAVAAATALALWLGSHSALAQKSRGVLKMPDFASPASMSIHEEVTRAAVTVLMPVFNNLVLFDQHKEKNTLDTIVPDLAESWTWSEDGRELTFKLRHGVKWHDGKPFTAADVKCTWDRDAARVGRLRINAAWSLSRCTKLVPLLASGFGSAPSFCRAPSPGSIRADRASEPPT